MASSHHNEAAKMEQVITEFFAKTLHIILESRSSYVSSRNYSGEHTLSSPSSSSSSSSGVRPRDKWFNLALRECPAALENFDIWRQSNLEPMFIDVILVQKPLEWGPGRNFSSKERYPFSWNSDQEELGPEAKSEKIIERWIVQYESRKSRDSGSINRRSSNTLHMLYKKSILLLRSLYATVKLLPAYKIFRDLNSSSLCTFSLTHRVSSFVEPFTRKEEAEMQRFGFTPVDTSNGRLCLSVVYRSSISDVNSEPSTPISPQVIPDYVGSPLANPSKRYSSQNSPSSLRRHSWSFDHYKASSPSFPFPPSPAYSESHVSISNPNTRRYTPSNLPPHPPESSSLHKKDTTFDEYCPSPNFTPSPSPSPPIYIPGCNLSKALLRSGSAPVNIPTAKIGRSAVLSNKQNLHPSPIKGTRYGITNTDASTGLVQTDTSFEKMFSLGKDDTRKYSGLRVSMNSSPRSFSRSFPDDFDDSDFPCPFDVEDDDMTDPGSRHGSFDCRGRFFDPLEHGIRKSQDAAVGALVRMLKKAPPLMHSQAPDIQQPCSRVAHSKTTADALEELSTYRDMVRQLLHNKANLRPAQDHT